MMFNNLAKVPQHQMKLKVVLNYIFLGTIWRLLSGENATFLRWYIFFVLICIFLCFYKYINYGFNT